MYLDRPIKEAELLQTIARVNRTGHGKQFGIVVDYYGLAHHLKAALDVYADGDVEGALQSLKDELPVLRDRHLRVVDLFRRHGIDGLDDHEACVQALADERLRGEFAVKLKQFLDSLDLILPRPEALPFSADAKRLALIYVRARNRYRDTPELGKDVGAKVRRLIDEHVVSLGIDPKIPPVSLTDAKFDQQVGRAANQRAKASEMEHAIRAHIREHVDEDPVLYRKLSEKLEALLQKLGSQWEQLADALKDMVSAIRAGHATVAGDVDAVPEQYAPFLRLLTDAVPAGATSPAAARPRLQDLAVELVDTIVAELTPNFWGPANQPSRDALATRLFEILMKARLLPADALEALTDKLMALARANHARLLQ
jgi:type I restriction enzyme R subunit